MASRSINSYMACKRASARVLPEASPLVVVSNNSGRRWKYTALDGTHTRPPVPKSVPEVHSPMKSGVK